MTLRTIIHAAANGAAWRAKATTFAGVTALAITIGDDEVLVFVRPDQAEAASKVAEAINAALGACQNRPDHARPIG